MRGIPKWMTNLSIWVAAKIGCPPGYSLCAAAYEYRLDGIRGFKTVVDLIDRVFWWDKHHCRKAWLLRSKN